MDCSNNFKNVYCMTAAERAASKADETVVPLDDLVELYGPYRSTHGVALGAIRSASSWISILASLLLVWVVLRSRVGPSCTFHRLLLGLCAADIVHCMGTAHFNLMAPRDDDYVVWNARGTAVTCSAAGYLARMGGTAGESFFFHVLIQGLPPIGGYVLPACLIRIPFLSHSFPRDQFSCTPSPSTFTTSS